MKNEATRHPRRVASLPNECLDLFTDSLTVVSRRAGARLRQSARRPSKVPVLFPGASEIAPPTRAVRKAPRWDRVTTNSAEKFCGHIPGFQRKAECASRISPPPL